MNYRWPVDLADFALQNRHLKKDLTAVRREFLRSQMKVQKLAEDNLKANAEIERLKETLRESDR